MKNREYLIEQLKNPDFIDDNGASYEAMLNYTINCPHFNGDKRALCYKKEPDRDLCFKCKKKWLDSEVEE